MKRKITKYVIQVFGVPASEGWISKDIKDCGLSHQYVALLYHLEQDNLSSFGKEV